MAGPMDEQTTAQVQNTPITAASTPKLVRVLGLGDLILYGIVLIMPIAAVPLFGVVQQLSNGHAVTTILLAMVAMMLTAYSYGRMAACYPSAGSAYVYAGRGLNPHLGFLAGWAMLLDYLLVPLICTIYGALTIQRLIPSVPYSVWAAIFAGLMTLINLRGIRATVNANLIMMITMMVVILVFMGLATHWLFASQGWSGLISTRPFYDPSTFSWKSIIAATSVAALTYGGFDGVSTLSEEVRNPRRNVLIATVFVCFFTGIFGGLQIYLAQRIVPDMHALPNVETAFMDVTRVVGGVWLFDAMAVILLIANMGAGLSAQAGISRLLFGMGRDGVLPRRIFAHLDKKRHTPVYSIVMVGAFAYFGSLVLDYERSAELINFGAFLAFMAVNAAVIRQFYFTKKREGRNLIMDALFPFLGFCFCFAIWINLQRPAKILGSCWFLFGLIVDAVQTRGFRKTPSMENFAEM
jgi:putrescine importer